MTLRMVEAIVEDIKDPEKLGRVKCRIIHYDGTKKDIPTEKLPWVTMLAPQMGPGAQGVAGAGLSPVGIRPGATVQLLVDDVNPEYRVSVGSIPYNADTDSASARRVTAASLSGAATPTPGTAGPHTAPFDRPTKATKEVLPVDPQYIRIPGEYTETFSTKTDSGMFFILHDKKGQAFYSMVHPSGTFFEMQSDGSLLTQTRGDRKEAVDGQYTLGAEKSLAIFTNKDAQLRVKDGTLFIQAKNIVIDVEQNFVEQIGQKKTSVAGSTQTIIGSPIHLNPDGGPGISFAGLSTGLTTGLSTSLTSLASQAGSLPDLSGAKIPISAPQLAMPDLKSTLPSLDPSKIITTIT